MSALDNEQLTLSRQPRLTGGAFYFGSTTSARRFTVVDGDKSDKSPGAA